MTMTLTFQRSVDSQTREIYRDVIVTEESDGDQWTVARRHAREMEWLGFSFLASSPEDGPENWVSYGTRFIGDPCIGDERVIVVKSGEAFVMGGTPGLYEVEA
jgi:hypothetical protein